MPTPEEILHGLATVAEPEPSIVGPEKTVHVKYQLADGRVLEGDFIYRVPTDGERRRIDLLAASLRQGVPVASFTDAANGALHQTAYLAVTIRERPDWCNSLDDLPDPRIAFKLYEEGLQHEARFLGAGCDLGASENEGGEPDV